MSEIVSMSMSNELLGKLNSAEKGLGFSGRSETLRAAINLLVDEHKQRALLKGRIDAVMLIIHDDVPEEISKIRHRHNHSIKTQIHNHLSSGKCLELFIVSDKAGEIKKMANDFERNKKIEFAKLVVP